MSAILRFDKTKNSFALLATHKYESDAFVELKTLIDKYKENGYEVLENKNDIYTVEMCKSESGYIFNTYDYITLKILNVKKEPLFYTKHVMNLNLINELKKSDKSKLKKVVLKEKKYVKTNTLIDDMIREMEERRKSTSFDLVEDESDNEEF